MINTPLPPFTATDPMITLVQNNSALILVMGRFGLPLGFGEKTVGEVCKLHNVDEETFLAVVNFVTNREFRHNKVTLPSLIGYLKKAHEFYLNFNLPQIRRKLIEAIDCSETNDISMLIVKFYDDYATRVRRHMEHEDKVVFTYVEQLLNGYLSRDYSIDAFTGRHAPINSKLQELKDVIIRYYPENNNYLLNSALLDIIMCETDITSHCMIEDQIFIPAVKKLESQLFAKKETPYSEDATEVAAKGKPLEPLSEREKDVLIAITKGMSNKEIANALCLSVHTVTTHRRNISAKLQIHSTAGLIIYAIANKLVNLQDIK